MIIFGTRGLKSKQQGGQFYCPGCDSQREYAWYRVRNWFTLYFIPVIPLNIAGEYLECRVCLRTLETVARERDRSFYEAENQAFQAEFEKAVKNIMVLIMLADGKIENSEMEMIQNIHEKVLGSEYTTNEISRDIDRLQREKTSIREYAGKMGGLLNDGGKRTVYQAALLVAMADGNIAKDEEALLDQVVKGLGISRGDVKQIRKELSSPA